MKSDEKILCIPRSVIPCDWLKGNGASLLDESVFRASLRYGDSSFQKRGVAETDSAWKQLIPYVVVERPDGCIMAYQRHGSETRLHGFYSIGAGGHVNDGDKQDGDLFATLVAGARREIREELGFDPEDRLVLRGIINEELTEAGKVHLGVVFSLRVQDTFIPGLFPELAGAKFLSIFDIQKLNLEHWSRLAFLLFAHSKHATFRDQCVSQLRQLLSGNCVVALDTNVINKLESESPPNWFPQFEEMSRRGVKFSIPDLCVGERLECFAHPNPICLPAMREKWRRMVDRLDAILWKELPCLPSQGDLYDLAGIQAHEAAFIRANPFSPNLSKNLYQLLHDYEVSPFNSPQYRADFEEEIEKERGKWKEWVLRLREGEDTKTMTKEQLFSWMLSRHEANFVPHDKITDLLKLPIRFVVERVSDPDYDPYAKKCHYQGVEIKPKNDGLDYHILYLTMLSINICSFDGFFQQARSLNLPRCCCCYSPETLFEAWHHGDLPKVIFKTS